MGAAANICEYCPVFTPDDYIIDCTENYCPWPFNPKFLSFKLNAPCYIRVVKNLGVLGQFSPSIFFNFDVLGHFGTKTKTTKIVKIHKDFEL